MKPGVCFALLFLALLLGRTSFAVTQYSDLPCPSTDEADRLLQKVHASKEVLPGSGCDDSIRGKFVKLLYFMDRLKTDIPESWSGGAVGALSDPIRYLSENNTEILLDLRQTQSIAYNAGLGRIYLGGMFVESNPLEAMTTLIHETRHSFSSADEHELCRWGDAPKTYDVCDEEFGTGKYVGAYSYEVGFSLGLAAFNQRLSEEDRDFLRTSAVGVIATRFNKIPNNLALPFDYLATLDENGVVSFLHPFLRKQVLQKVSIPGSKITRIEPLPGNTGFYLFTDTHQLFSWKPGDVPRKVASDVEDVAQINLGGNALYYAIDTSGALRNWRFDTETRKWELVKSTYQPQTFRAKRLILGGLNESYVLDEIGVLHSLDVRNKTRFEISSFATDGGWQSISSGVLFDVLFGLSKKGQLFYKNAGKNETFLSPFQTGSQAIKFAEGTGFAVQLDRDGNIFIAGHSSPGEMTKVTPPQGGAKTIDVAIGRNWRVSEALFASPQPRVEFQKSCRAVTSRVEPWMGKGVGITESGKLVFEGTPEEPCWIFPDSNLPFALKKIGLSGSEIDADNRFLAQVFLELRADADQVRIRPYSLE